MPSNTTSDFFWQLFGFEKNIDKLKDAKKFLILQKAPKETAHWAKTNKIHQTSN